MTQDAFDPQRFLDAQDGVFVTAVAELKAGRKRSHWMWFVFPQLKGLGMSSTAQVYGLASREAARAYLAHPVLGARLVQATQAVRDSGAPSLHALFGSPDDLKFHSCMTLFEQADQAGPWRAALDQWCAGEPDPLTLALLQSR